MQTVETIVLLVFSVIVAGMIIMFMTGFDFMGIYDSVLEMMMPGHGNGDEVRKVNFNQFAAFTYDCWQKCGFGATEMRCGSVLLQAEGMPGGSMEITEGFLQNEFEKLNFCTDCSIDMPRPIFLPAVVSVSCNEGGSGKLKIT